MLCNEGAVNRIVNLLHKNNQAAAGRPIGKRAILYPLKEKSPEQINLTIRDLISRVRGSAQGSGSNCTTDQDLVNSPRFSATNKAGNRSPISAHDAHKIINRIVGGWKVATMLWKSEIRLVKSFDQLPKAIQQAAKEQGAEGDI